MSRLHVVGCPYPNIAWLYAIMCEIVSLTALPSFLEPFGTGADEKI